MLCVTDVVAGGSDQAAATSQAPRRTQSSLKKSQQPSFDFRSRAEKRLSFTLVFETLKCEISIAYKFLVNMYNLDLPYSISTSKVKKIMWTRRTLKNLSFKHIYHAYSILF